MMCQEIIRVDDRFIHGQVLLGWARGVRLRRLVVGNDQLAREEARKRLFELMETPQLSISILSVEGAVEALKAERGGNGVMVIVGSLADALRYYLAGRKVKQINVGCQRFEVGKMPVSDSVFLGEDDQEVLARFAELGVAVEARGLPSDRPRDLIKMVKGRAKAAPRRKSRKKGK